MRLVEYLHELLHPLLWVGVCGWSNTFMSHCILCTRWGCAAAGADGAPTDPGECVLLPSACACLLPAVDGVLQACTARVLLAWAQLPAHTHRHL